MENTYDRNLNNCTHVDLPIVGAQGTEPAIWADFIDFGTIEGFGYDNGSIGGKWINIVTRLNTLIGDLNDKITALSERVSVLENVAPTYMITFNVNGMNSVVTPSPILNIQEGTTFGDIELPSITFASMEAEYTFKYWTWDSEGRFRILSQETINDNITLYAQYHHNIIIKFNLNGGTGTLPEGVIDTTNDTLTYRMPGNSGFTREGHEFLGWVDNQNAQHVGFTPGDDYTFGPGIHTLYAYWNKIPVQQYYFYVGMIKPTSLSDANTVESYPSEQTYTNNSGAKLHMFVLTNNDKTVTFIEPNLNSPIDQAAVDTTTIDGYKIWETGTGIANGATIKIQIV